MASRPWLWIGIGCFVVEFVAWLAFLSVIPLAQGVLLGMMGIVAVMLGGRIWFHERFTRLRGDRRIADRTGRSFSGDWLMSSKRFYLAGFVVLIVFDTLSQVCFKVAAMHAEPFMLEPAWLIRVLSEPWIYGSHRGGISALS